MTKKLRLGLVLGSDRPGWVERAQRAEELGFDYLGTGEHMMFHGPTGNALITLAAMLRIPVYMHNVGEEKVFRPSAWTAFGTADLEGADFRACKNFGALYRKV